MHVMLWSICLWHELMLILMWRSSAGCTCWTNYIKICKDQRGRRVFFCIFFYVIKNNSIPVLCCLQPVIIALVPVNWSTALIRCIYCICEKPHKTYVKPADLLKSKDRRYSKMCFTNTVLTSRSVRRHDTNTDREEDMWNERRMILLLRLSLAILLLKPQYHCHAL